MSLDFSTLAQLHWLRPHWLPVLLALPLLAWWWRARRRQRSVWRDVVDAHLLPYLLDARPDTRTHGALWRGLLACTLAVCALAGPSWQRSEQPLWQSRAPLLIAIDLSSATLAADLPPSRLAQARAKLATLLRERAGGQVGLVAFADDAYTVAPLTDDADNVALFLDALSPDIMPTDGRPTDGRPTDGRPTDGRPTDGRPTDGSRADRAIAWSAQLLRQAGFDRGDIVLLSDHADAAARSAASAAARTGYRVSALGLGTAAGSAYRDSDGRIAQARLDAASLRTLAQAGGGRYSALTPGDADLAAIGVLDPQQAGTMATHGEKTFLWRDQGYWLLLPLMLLALFAFRRGGALAAVLLLAWLPLQPAHAAENDWWQRPDQQTHARMQQGVEIYRKNDFAAATQAWKGVPGADAAYNRGNALAKQGSYDDAIAAYDQALRLQPGMADAIANKQAVQAARKRQPPSGNRQGQQHKKDSGKQPGPQKPQAVQPGAQNQAGDKQAGDNQDGQGRAGQAPPPSSSQKKDDAQAQAGTPQDTQAQRDADAAQRARMQQALQAGQPSGKLGSQPQQRAASDNETAAQREHRLANEAWLRRVPDDPGGLLRERFRLEYERRQQGSH